MFAKFVLAVTLLIMPAISIAEWLKIHEEENIKFFVDVNRLKFKDGYVYVWEKKELKSPIPFDEKDTYDKAVGLKVLDCNEHRAMYISGVIYNNDKSIGEFNYKFSEDGMKYTIPDSVGDIILTKTCNLKRLPKP